MVPKKLSLHFNFLETSKHNIYDDDLPSLFEEPNKSEYWLLSDLITTIKPSVNQNSPIEFRTFAKNELYSAFNFSFAPKQTSNQDFFEQHVIRFSKPIYKDSKTYYITDYKLSRFAILCALQKYNPNSFFDLVYFMSPSDTPVEQLYATTCNFARIPARQELKNHERQLSGVISKYGMQHNIVQGILQNALFHCESTDQIKYQHNIPLQKPITDYMGRLSLIAKTNTISNTLQGTNQRKASAQTFIAKLQQCATEQRRNMLSKYGIAPENSIYSQPINKTIQELKSAYKNALAKYASEKLR